MLTKQVSISRMLGLFQEFTHECTVLLPFWEAGTRAVMLSLAVGVTMTEYALLFLKAGLQLLGICEYMLVVSNYEMAESRAGRVCVRALFVSAGTHNVFLSLVLSEH